MLQVQNKQKQTQGKAKLIRPTVLQREAFPVTCAAVKIHGKQTRRSTDS